MAYTASMLNVNTAANVNETVLPLAYKRNNILQDARLLGYEIEHIKSYRYLLKIFFPEGNYIIPKYQEFTSGDKKYYFIGNTISGNFTSQQVDNNENFIEVEVMEGVLYLYEENPDTLITTTTTVVDERGDSIDQYYVDVPYMDVEENGIEVFVTYYNEEGILVNKEEWTKSDQFMIDKDTDLQNKFVRLDNIKYRTPRVYFKLSGVGNGVRLNSIVQVNCVVSSGVDGVMTELPSTSLLNATVDSFTLVSSGTREEDSLSIKENAPLFYNSANRVITKSDYIAFCNRQSSVKVSEVWGGEDELPVVPGHIWFSFLPSTLYRDFTSNLNKTEFTLDNAEDINNWYLEEEDIRGTNYDINGNLINPGVWDVLDEHKVPTLVFHNRAPIYMDFEFNINIMKYSIQTTIEDTHQQVFDVINEYFNTTTKDHKKVEAFWYEYFHSNLEKRIDQSLTDITGFNNTLTTRIMLGPKSLVQEDTNQDNYDIHIPMSVPYEKIFDSNGDLITSRLPNIDTPVFNGVDDLAVDWSGLTGGEKDSELIVGDILVGGEVSGKYQIVNTFKQYINIQLYVKDNGSSGVYSTSNLLKNQFDITRYLNVKHFSPNFKMYKNTIPRLRKVIFS
jgi:hypothetical protein